MRATEILKPYHFFSKKGYAISGSAIFLMVFSLFADFFEGKKIFKDL